MKNTRLNFTRIIKASYNKGIERDAGIAVILFHFSLCAPAPLMPGVKHNDINFGISRSNNMKIKSHSLCKFLLLSVCLFLMTFCGVDYLSAEDNLNPEIILEKMEKTYLKITSYQDAGVVERVVISKAGELNTTTPFLLIFKRPDYLRFEWIDTMLGNDHHIIGSDGKIVYSYWEHRNEYEKEKSLDMAIAGATGISQGSAHTVPTMLIGNNKGFNLRMLSELTLLPKENVEGTWCYVITGKHPMGSIDKLWIGVDDYLLRKLETSVMSYEKSMKMIKKSQKEQSTDFIMPDFSKLGDFSSITKEIHRDIRIGIDINEEKFKFIPPKGTKIVED